MFKRALEIGGPSRSFFPGGSVPVYPNVEVLDDVDFAASTAWTPQQAALSPRGRRPGRRFVTEGATLAGLPPDARYDLLLASHCLEHMANPLGAVSTWLRFLSPGARVCVVVPDRRLTFDHRRPVTPFAHLLADHAAGTGEDDLTHLDEVLALHDLSMDPLAGSAVAFAARSWDNANNRCLHHHVFDANLLCQVFIHFGLSIQQVAHAAPCDIVCIGVAA